MNNDPIDSGDSYRWRLVRAAAASMALHMLIFGGLSVSRLELASKRPDEPEARAAKNSKRASDFRLQVPRSASTEKPVHERPLSISLPAAAAKEPVVRERPAERSVAERRDAPPEIEQPPQASELKFERSRSEEPPAPSEPRATPERRAETTPAQAAATADTTDINTIAAATAEAGATPAVTPAATQPRERAAAGPVAARWRPREVTLLEKLTARTPDAESLAVRPAAESPTQERPTNLARQSPATPAATTAARAESIAAAATAAAAPARAATPAEREAARRNASARATANRSAAQGVEPSAAAAATSIARGTLPAATVTRSAGSSGASQARPAGGGSPTRASTAMTGEAAGTAATVAAAPATSSTSAGQAAPAPSALATAGGGAGRRSPRSVTAGGGSRQAGVAGAGRDGDPADGTLAGRIAGSGSGAATIGGGLRGGRDGLTGSATGLQSPGRDGRGFATDSSGTGTVAALTGLAGLAGSGTGTGGSGGEGSDAGPPGAATGSGLMPAAINRGRRAGGRSTLATSRGAGGGMADKSGDGEGLSISPADLATLAATGRDRTGLPTGAPGPRSPERIAAAALPADGRVRDVAEAFAGRSGGSGEPAGGITDREALDRARAMVDRGLEFLSRSQLADGRWRLTEFAGVTPADVPKLDSDTAATGLALLCFLGAGHDHFSGPHRDTVRRGLEFLISVQKPDGDLFLPADDLSNSCSWLYSHGIASIAVCEAVGMTGDPLVRPAAEKACRFIATSRHPTLGGWRYIPRTDADLSVSGWMLVALRAGDLAGVKTDPAALGGVRTLLAASSSPSDPTRFAYNARKADQRRTDLSVACMTAVGGLMRLHTGAAADDPSVVAPAKLLAGFPPAYGTRSQRVRDSYLWYYASQVLVHTGGPDWQAWYGSLVDTLDQPQRRDGPLAGSWDAAGELPDRWGEYGGRMYVTTLHILALEVPWRHLPTYATAPSR